MKVLITKAIAARAVVSVDYGGSSRLVEPHTYGVNSAGHEVLSCFQTRDSKSGAIIGWRTLLVADISTFTLTQDVFERNRPGFVRNGKSFQKIVAQLQD
ncbi:MAG: hypothetical protein JWQ72_3409 [Polaromonas sp.]|nr:hypothetical protein [Polaromonas sp.]